MNKNAQKFGEMPVFLAEMKKNNCLLSLFFMPPAQMIEKRKISGQEPEFRSQEKKLLAGLSGICIITGYEKILSIFEAEPDCPQNQLTFPLMRFTL